MTAGGASLLGFLTADEIERCESVDTVGGSTRFLEESDCIFNRETAIRRNVIMEFPSDDHKLRV